MLLFKESRFSLAAENRDPASRAIHLFYLDLIDFVVEGLAAAFNESENVAVLDMPIPVVVAGGTSMRQGFVELFAQALRQRELPLEISEVRAARDPLNAVAIGCLEYARANRQSV
jgi:hypothetical protein